MCLTHQISKELQKLSTAEMALDQEHKEAITALQNYQAEYVNAMRSFMSVRYCLFVSK